MTAFKKQLADYHNNKKTGTAHLLHQIGVPTYIFGLFMALSWINLDLGNVIKISFAWLLLILVLVYYAVILGNYKLTGVTGVVLVILNVLAAWLAGPTPSGSTVVLCLIFLGGSLGLLFASNSMHKHKTSLLQQAKDLLVAPMLLVHELMAMLGLDKIVHDDTK